MPPCAVLKGVYNLWKLANLLLILKLCMVKGWLLHASECILNLSHMYATVGSVAAADMCRVLICEGVLASISCSKCVVIKSVCLLTVFIAVWLKIRFVTSASLCCAEWWRPRQRFEWHRLSLTVRSRWQDCYWRASAALTYVVSIHSLLVCVLGPALLWLMHVTFPWHRWSLSTKWTGSLSVIDFDRHAGSTVYLHLCDKCQKLSSAQWWMEQRIVFSTVMDGTESSNCLVRSESKLCFGCFFVKWLSFLLLILVVLLYWWFCVQFMSLCNLQNALRTLPRVRVTVGVGVRVRFRSEICR